MAGKLNIKLSEQNCQKAPIKRDVGATKLTTSGKRNKLSNKLLMGENASLKPNLLVIAIDLESLWMAFLMSSRQHVPGLRKYQTILFTARTSRSQNSYAGLHYISQSRIQVSRLEIYKTKILLMLMGAGH